MNNIYNKESKTNLTKVLIYLNLDVSLEGFYRLIEFVNYIINENKIKITDALYELGIKNLNCKYGYERTIRYCIRKQYNISIKKFVKLLLLYINKRISLTKLKEYLDKNASR